MEIKTFSQIRFNSPLTIDEVKEKYTDLLNYHRELLRKVDKLENRHKRTLVTIASLKHSLKIAKDGRRRNTMRYNNVKRAYQKLKHKVIDEKKNLKRTGARLKNWRITYNFCLTYAFIESKRCSLGLSRKELLLLTILYPYKEIKLSELYDRHPDIVNRGYQLKSNIQPIIDEGFVIRHKYGQRNSTLCLTMLGRKMIENLSAECGKYEQQQRSIADTK